MSPLECNHEAEIIQASRSGQWTETLQNHLATCQACRSAHQLALMFSDLAAQTQVNMPVAPDPDLIWLKAALNAPRREQRRSPGIALAALVAFVTLATLAYRFWFSESTVGPSFGLSPFAGAPFPLDATLAVLLVAVALVLVLPSSGSGRPSTHKSQRLVAL
jgi:predicted anti-sigma-YlaC factor YlaD